MLVAECALRAEHVRELEERLPDVAERLKLLEGPFSGQTEPLFLTPEDMTDQIQAYAAILRDRVQAGQDTAQAILDGTEPRGWRFCERSMTPSMKQLTSSGAAGPETPKRGARRDGGGSR